MDESNDAVPIIIPTTNTTELNNHNNRSAIETIHTTIALPIHSETNIIEEEPTKTPTISDIQTNIIEEDPDNENITTIPKKHPNNNIHNKSNPTKIDEPTTTTTTTTESTKVVPNV